MFILSILYSGTLEWVIFLNSQRFFFPKTGKDRGYSGSYLGANRKLTTEPETRNIQHTLTERLVQRRYTFYQQIRHSSSPA